MGKTYRLSELLGRAKRRAAEYVADTQVDDKWLGLSFDESMISILEEIADEYELRFDAKGRVAQ